MKRPLSRRLALAALIILSAVPAAYVTWITLEGHEAPGLVLLVAAFQFGIIYFLRRLKL